MKKVLKLNGKIVSKGGRVLKSKFGQKFDWWTNQSVLTTVTINQLTIKAGYTVNTCNKYFKLSSKPCSSFKL